MVTRRGHSLAELLVTLSLLGATLGPMAAAARDAAGATDAAVRRQRALSAADAVLDSLLAAPDPRAGESAGPGLRLVWVVAPTEAGRSVRVTALGADGLELAVLDGFWIPAPPPLAAGS